jgi:predicted nucleotidyltransferase
MDFPSSAEFEQLIAGLSRELSARGIRFMLIGGQAVLVHGEPRLTQDVDVTLGIGPDDLTPVLEVCQALGLRPLPDNPEAFVRRTFVLPVLDEGVAVRVDLIFSTTPYERQAISRSVPVEIAGVNVPFAAAEDLVLHKLFAGRPRDVEDARGVVRRKGAELDWPYLARWAAKFAAVPGCEDLPASVDALRQELGR